MGKCLCSTQMMFSMGVRAFQVQYVIQHILWKSHERVRQRMSRHLDQKGSMSTSKFKNIVQQNITDVRCLITEYSC